MSGYRFWKQEESKSRPVSEFPALFWPTIKRWGDGTDDDRTSRFNIDGATGVYRNGLVAKAVDLAIGDHVLLSMKCGGKRKIWRKR